MYTYITPKNAQQAARIAYASTTSKTRIPVLSHVHIRSTGESLVMTGTDRESAARESIPARVESPLETCVPGKPWRDWINVIAQCYPDSQIRLELDESTQILACTLIGEGIRSRTAFKCIDAQEFPEVESLLSPVDPWIKKAVCDDGKRPTLSRSFGRFAADGYRIHYDSRLPLVIPECESVDFTDVPAKVGEIYTSARAGDNIARIPARDLLPVVKRAKKLTDRVKLHLNGSLIVSMTGDNESTSTQELTHGYSHTGPDSLIDVSPAFLIDALSGMNCKTGELTIKVSLHPDPNIDGNLLYVTDGTREAVIMGMTPEESTPEPESESVE